MGQGTAVTTKQGMPPALQDALTSRLSSIGQILPPDISLDEFRAATWLVMQDNPRIMQCQPESVMVALVKAANSGMLPGRDCYIIPYSNKATFVRAYEGIIRALDRTGKVAKAFAQPVYEHDFFEIDYLTDLWSHRPARRDRGELDCFYGCIVMKDGTRHVQVVSLEQINQIRAAAPSAEKGPWADWYEQMARKTALKQVAKYVHLTDAVQEEFAADDRASRQSTVIAETHGEPIDMKAALQGPTSTKRAEIGRLCGKFNIAPQRRGAWLLAQFGSELLTDRDETELDLIIDHLLALETDAFPAEESVVDEPSDNPSDAFATSELPLDDTQAPDKVTQPF